MAQAAPLMLPTAYGGIARLAVARCRDADVDPLPLLNRVGLTPDAIDDPRIRLSVECQVMLLDLAADALSDDVLGFHLAQSFELREAGLVYFVLASSATLGDALKRAERYSTIANEGLRLQTLPGADVGIRLAAAGIPRYTDRHQFEFWVTAVVRMAGHLTGRKLRPARAVLAHSRCGSSGELEAFFGCSVSFGAGEDVIAYDTEAAALPLTDADPYLNDLLVTYCEEALAHRRCPPEALRTRVENAITTLLPHGKARADAVARALGMSQRTLARRLTAEGLSFADVLGTMRADLAMHYLGEKDLSVSEIAWLVGFQEVSAFTHAFKRWTGRTPTQVRAGR